MTYSFTKLTRLRVFKTLVYMKLITFLLTVVLFNLSASTYSQSKKFDLAVENVSYRKIVKEIKKKSEFRFLYNSEVINELPNMTIEVKNQMVEEILDLLLLKHGLEYEIDDKTITIREAKTERVANSSQKEVMVEVTGTVKDADSGEPLPGVNVVVKGTTIGSVTDRDGVYGLNVDEGAILSFSYIGYETVEVTVGSRSVVDIQLSVDVGQLEEIVVVGMEV